MFLPAACQYNTAHKVLQKSGGAFAQKGVDKAQANRMKLDELAQYLYEKETITGDEFMKILEKK